MQNNTFSTLFVGQNLIRLITVDSTSDYLKALASKSEPLPEGTVIMADHQYKGRGQQGSKWLTEAGKNLTFSIFLKPSFLKAETQFLLNIAVSLGINRALSPLLNEQLSIKWPNDVYYGNQKLGGILIENTLSNNNIKHSVVGIGINVNQTQFDGELTGEAISIIQVLDKNFDLQILLSRICETIEAAYLKLKEGQNELLKKQYLDKLYRGKQRALFKSNGRVFEGKITGIEDSGLLLLDINGEIQKFNAKEIVFIK